MRSAPVLSLLILVPIAAGSTLAQAPLPPVPGAHVVTISQPDERGNEPSIAVNPYSPNQVAAVFQGKPKVAYSTDSGKTFARAQGTEPSDWRVAGDVSITFDNKGHAFLCYLAFDHLGTPYYWGHDGGPNGIFVRRSLDGGKTWEAQPAAVKAFRTEHGPDTPWEDMPRIFADNAPHSPYAGSLYVGWIEWQLDKSIMLFSRSTDDGKTWSSPIRVSTHAGLPRDDNGALVGFTGTVGADGTIYAVWSDGSTIAFTTSRDGGRTFAPSRSIVETGPPYFGNVAGVSRVMGFPQIGVDQRTGANGGRLYVSWSDYRNGDIDVFVASSADHGHTWSRPVRVNGDALHDGLDQFFQWMAVDPVTGAVYVQFYDRRDDPDDRKTRVTLARSADGGKTFTNYAWSDAAFQGQRAFLGDYTWLTAYDGRVYGVWAESVPAGDSAASNQGRRRGEGTVVRVGIADFSRTR